MIRWRLMSFVAARRVLPAALWVVGLVSAPSVVRAQSDEQRAAARSLATEGATAFNEGRFKEAVDYFGKAESLMHAPPHLLFLARSHVKLGQLVRAREAYLKIVKETLPANAPKAFRDAQTAAETEVRDVEPKIASLTIRIEGGEGATDVGVMVDGVALPNVLVGLAQPIDPGTHRIEAGATGFRAPSEPVTLAEGEKKSVVLKLESAPGAAPLVAGPAAAAPAGAAPAPGTTPAPAAATAPTASPTTDTGPQKDSGGGLRIGSYVAFGVGAIGLAGGALFTLQSASKRKDADSTFAACSAEPGGCHDDDPRSAQTDELDRDADSKKTLGIVGFAVGGVGVAAGVTLLVLSSGGDEKKAGIQPWIGLGSAGLRGRF